MASKPVSESLKTSLLFMPERGQMHSFLPQVYLRNPTASLPKRNSRKRPKCNSHSYFPPPPERREHVRVRDAVAAGLQAPVEVLRRAPRLLPPRPGEPVVQRVGLQPRLAVQVQRAHGEGGAPAGQPSPETVAKGKEKRKFPDDLLVALLHTHRN